MLMRYRLLKSKCTERTVLDALDTQRKPHMVETKTKGKVIGNKFGKIVESPSRGSLEDHEKS